MESIRVRRVGSIEELKEVWKLTYDVYREKGLCSPKADGYLIHYPEQDISPDGGLYPLTSVWYIEQRGEVVSTISLTFDGPAGLHAEHCFWDEVARVRLECNETEKSLAASWRIVNRGSRALLWQLIDVVWKAISDESIDVTLFTFHPKHARFYEQCVGLTTIAGPRCDETVNNSPAVLMRGDKANLSVWEISRLGLMRHHRVEVT